MNLRIQNNGLGVQSTTLFLMSHEGLIDPIQHSVFADTGEEPQAVYQHLAWLRTVPAPVPILHVGTIGRLGDHLIAGTVGAGGRKKHKVGLDGTTRFATIPAFTAPPEGERYPGWKEGIVRRQCTKEYKIEVVERIIRRTILGLKPRQRIPRDVEIVQVFGISWDERVRAADIAARFANRKRPLWWSKPSFPLVDMRMTRQDCLDFLKGRVPHETPRSACVFCPYKRAGEWLRTKQNQADWARAIEIDRALRTEGTVAMRGMVQQLYLHRKCLPLTVIDFKAEADKEAEAKRMPLFDSIDDCGDGMCGV